MERALTMDQDGQLTFEDDPEALKIKTAVNHLRLGDFPAASRQFREVFDANPENLDAQAGIRASEFWNNRAANISSLPKGLEKGRYLKNEWNNFEEFLGDENAWSALPIQAIRTYIFTEAIHCFSHAYNNTIAPDITLYYDIGECYFNIKDFEKAIQTFEYAWEFKRDNSRVLARLADAYYALGEDTKTRKKARLLFREAFLYEPETIELERCAASWIVELIRKTGEAGFTGDEVAVWLPLYAAADHHFNVKRELDEHEVSMISGQVYALEKDLARPGSAARILLPKLLNRYIWLIDHYLIEEGDTIKVDILKKKFQETEPKFFNLIFK